MYDNMSYEELWRLYQETEKQFERNKFKRFIYTILVFSALFFYLMWQFSDIGNSFLEVLGSLGAAVFLAFCYVVFNVVVFSILFQRSNSENESLKRMKNELDRKQRLK